MDELKAIVARVLNIDTSQVNDELSQDNMDKWDSFHHLLLISEIENSMALEFTASDVEQARAFKDLKEIIIKKIVA